MSAATPWPVVVPLAGAVLALLVAGTRLARAVAALAMTATVPAAAWLARDVWRGDGGRYPVGGWPAPLGIELRADGAAAAMLVLSSVVGLALTVYAQGYYRPADGGRRAPWRPEHAVWPLWLLVFAALHAIFLSGDVFNLYVGLELLTLSALALLCLAPEPRAVEATMRYLLAALLGSMLYLLGVAILYAATHVLALDAIGARLAPGPAAWAAVALVTAGLALKSALFPLHFWLPRAHASAPAPVSALLSAFVVAGAVFVLLRLWFHAFGGVVSVASAQGVGALGAAAIVWGALQAIRQERLKLMVAYSTVAQVGYFFLLVPLATAAPDAAWRLDAWRGGLYLVAAHACAKAAMFMAAGIITAAIGHDRLHGVSGIAAHLPVTTYAFGIAGLSLIGLPPSGGFVGKWLLLTAAFASGQWWWAVVIVVGGILTAAYVFLVLGQELSRAAGDRTPRFQAVPRRMEWATMALALASLALGLRAVEPLALLAIDAPFTAPP